MSKYIWLFALLLSGCAKHTSIDYLYPEYAKQYVEITVPLYLVKIEQDNQINHPDYELLMPHLYGYHGDHSRHLTLPVGTVLYLEGFYLHNRFTESGTEVMGWTIIDERKIEFYGVLHHAYDGVKKFENPPWQLVSESSD